MRGFWLLLLVFILSVGCSNGTVAGGGAPTPTTNAATPISVTLPELQEAYFWAIAEAFDIPPSLGFELTLDIMAEFLFVEWDSRLQQIESEGIDVWTTLPYCMSAHGGMIDYFRLRSAASPADAVAPLNLFIDLIESMDINITAAREGVVGRSPAKECEAMEQESDLVMRNWSSSR